LDALIQKWLLTHNKEAGHAYACQRLASYTFHHLGEECVIKERSAEADS
jgi:hypothetical protein